MSAKFFGGEWAWVDLADYSIARRSSEALQFKPLSELLAAIHDSLLPHDLDLVSLRTARSLGGVAISRRANHNSLSGTLIWILIAAALLYVYRNVVKSLFSAFAWLYDPTL